MKEQCKACGVIIENDTVYFFVGEPGTRERLYARVCQYAKHPEKCINKRELKPLTEDDYYGK